MCSYPVQLTSSYSTLVLRDGLCLGGRTVQPPAPHPTLNSASAANAPPMIVSGMILPRKPSTTIKIANASRITPIRFQLVSNVLIILSIEFIQIRLFLAGARVTLVTVDCSVWLPAVL